MPRASPARPPREPETAANLRPHRQARRVRRAARRWPEGCVAPICCRTRPDQPRFIQHLGSPPGSERMHPPVNGVALIVASVPVTPPTKSIISLADPEAGSLLNRLADLPATRGSRQQLHWHENPQYRFAPRPDVMKDADWRRAVAARRSRAAVRTADFCQPVLEGAELARAFPDTVFVLEHGGMLEDMSPEGWQVWCDGMAAHVAMPQRPCQTLGARHLRSRLPRRCDRADREGDRRPARRGSLFLRQQFPDRKAVDGLRNAVSDLPRCHRASRRSRAGRYPARHRGAVVPDQIDLRVEGPRHCE